MHDVAHRPATVPSPVVVNVRLDDLVVNGLHRQAIRYRRIPAGRRVRRVRRSNGERNRRGLRQHRKVDYPAGFFPLSKGGLSDPTYNQSVATGITNLGAVVDAHSEDAPWWYPTDAAHAGETPADTDGT